MDSSAQLTANFHIAEGIKSLLGKRKKLDTRGECCESPRKVQKISEQTPASMILIHDVEADNVRMNAPAMLWLKTCQFWSFRPLQRRSQKIAASKRAFLADSLLHLAQLRKAGFYVGSYGCLVSIDQSNVQARSLLCERCRERRIARGLVSLVQRCHLYHPLCISRRLYLDWNTSKLAIFLIVFSAK